MPRQRWEKVTYTFTITTKGNWSTAATLPTFYKDCRVVATTGEHAPKQIYLVGGVIPHGFLDYHGVNASFRYDPAANCWNKTPDMPTAHSYGAVAVADDKIYAIGGMIERMDWVDNKRALLKCIPLLGMVLCSPRHPNSLVGFP